MKIGRGRRLVADQGGGRRQERHQARISFAFSDRNVHTIRKNALERKVARQRRLAGAAAADDQIQLRIQRRFRERTVRNVNVGMFAFTVTFPEGTKRLLRNQHAENPPDLRRILSPDRPRQVLLDVRVNFRIAPHGGHVILTRLKSAQLQLRQSK